MSNYSSEPKLEKKDAFVSEEVTVPSLSSQVATGLPTDREFIAEYADEYNPQGLVVAYEEDKQKYPVITANPPWITYCFLIVEFAERGSYYGVQGCLYNFVQRPLPTGSTTGKVFKTTQSAGALGLGLRVANAVTLLLTFLAYVAPLVGGYLADARFGRYKTIMFGAWLGFVAHILFIIAGLPTVIASGKALAPTIIAIITLACGTGAIKPNLLPLFMDQYPYKTDVLKVLADGSVVVVDRAASLESLTLFFYWSINIGAFLQIATSYAERRIGFWLAFLVPGIMYLLVCIFVPIIGRHIKKEVPEGSILAKFLRVLRVCFKGNWIKRIRNKTFWEYSFPSEINKRNGALNDAGKKSYDWTEQEVLDFKLTCSQSVLFLYWIFFNLNDSGLGSSETSQAGSMTSKGVPNDLFNNFNQITIVVLIPILDKVIYPLLRKYDINFRPVFKIFLGFMLGAFSSMYAAIVQWRVYKTSPCGWYATDCDGVSPLSAWIEIGVFALAAAGECFCMTQGYEIAYTRAPENSKGLVMALFLFMNALASAISEAVSGALIDPHLIYPFAALAIAGAVTAVMFLVQYWNLHKVMEKEEEEKRQNQRLAEEEKRAISNASDSDP